MEQDTKTITMPLHEYEFMNAELSNLKAQNKSDEYQKLLAEYRQLEVEYDFAVKEGDRLMFSAKRYDDIKKLYEMECKKNASLEKEIIDLKQEIAELKQKKWWQFWK